jgi:hypothetical protein
MAYCDVCGGGGHGGREISLVDGQDRGSSIHVTQPRILLRHCEQQVSVREKPWLAATRHDSVKVLHGISNELELGIMHSAAARKLPWAARDRGSDVLCTADVEGLHPRSQLAKLCDGLMYAALNNCALLSE